MRASTTARRGALVALALLAAGCTGGGPDGGTGGNTDGNTDGEPGELTVLAAASLTETFTDLAARFEADHPGVSVRLAFDSSATLAEQVLQGAPADVLATADERTLQRVADAGETEQPPRVFATNRLALVVPPDNPADVEGLADLDEATVDYVVCVDSAPCGALSRSVLDAAGVTHDPASEEVDVKAVLGKVLLGEADAGLVYRTDARAAADDVRTLPVPATGDTTTRYPVAVLAGADRPDLAAAWVDLVLSSEGRRVLRDAGFGAP